jgi:hypothetical protein
MALSPINWPPYNTTRAALTGDGDPVSLLDAL